MHAVPTLTCEVTSWQVCRRGLARALQLLVAAGADVTAVGADGRTALCWAAARRDTGIVRVLLLAGADTAVLGDAFQRAVLQQWQRDLISLRVRSGRASWFPLAPDAWLCACPQCWQTDGRSPASAPVMTAPMCAIVSEATRALNLDISLKLAC